MTTSGTTPRTTLGTTFRISMHSLFDNISFLDYFGPFNFRILKISHIESV